MAAHSQAGEILWSNAPYALGLVAALAHRPMASAMLNEVPAAQPGDPVRGAQLVVWFKLGVIPGVTGPVMLDPATWTPVANTELAVLYRRMASIERARPPRAAWPLGGALACIAAVVAAVVCDLVRRPRHGATLPLRGTPQDRGMSV
jgi:hypothetical protein